MPDPINALQNLASQGSRPIQSQMMPMNNSNMPNANMLQNLIHVSYNRLPMRVNVIVKFVYYFFFCSNDQINHQCRICRICRICLVDDQ